MDVKVDAAMRWDGVAPTRPGRVRRFFAGLVVILSVLAVVASVLWFLRAFIVPPTISIPGPMTLAGAPPEAPAAATDGRASVPETASQSAQGAAPDSSQSLAASAPDDSMPPPPLPMMQSLALAPPMLTFSAPPGAAVPTQEAIEPGVPISGPIPLPPRRPRAAAARQPAPGPAQAPVPLTPPRPAQ